ncbi:MAG TPA: hypothetical protein VLV54_20240, partial [Thermoanaerobaculia bacterium]|nr:hypothetical protein [Thermoanaerobaculia bacterium]
MEALTRGFRRVWPLASALALPLGLLAFHRVALLIPVPGALSTPDWVAFWSTGAYIYFALLFVFTGGIVIAILKWGLPDDAELVKSFAVGVGIAYLAGSYFLLPADGWSPLYMPFVAHVAAIKVLLIQPWLVPLAGAALASHFLLAVSGRSFAHRELNKFLLVLAVTAGLLQLSVQVRGLEDVRKSLPLAESPKTDKERTDGEAQGDPPEKLARGEIRNFLGAWAARLGSIRRCGVNLVEGASPATCPAPVESNSPWARAQAPRTFNALFWVASGFVVLAVLCERVWPRDRAPGPAPPGSAEGVVGSWAPISVAFGKRRRVSRLGLFDWQRAGSRFLLGRDWHGSRHPGSLVLRALREAPDHVRMLSTVPAECRLALIAADARNLIDDAERKLFEGGSLERYPHATWLTRVDLACAKHGAVSTAAARSLPADLWPGAARRLLRSEYVEARMAGTRCRAARHDTLLRLCTTDGNADVRQAAWRRIKETIAPTDKASLIHSEHADVRAWVAASGKLSPLELLSMCEQDDDSSVRDAALGSLGAMSAGRALRLSHSQFPDVRRRAVSSGRLRHDRLRVLLRFDPVAEVRQDAWQVCFQHAKVEGIEALLAGGDRKSRPQAASRPELSLQRRLQLCADDWQAEARQAAWDSLPKPLAPADAARLASSPFGDSRVRAIGTGLLQRERLIERCAGDCLLTVR